MLQMAYETFARRLTTLLTSGLRQVCKVTIVDISQRSYEEYVTELETQTLMVPISVPPLAGTGILQFSLPTALSAIDHMLGGPGGKQPPRTLTEIETTILRGLLDQMVDVLRYSFESIVAIHPSIDSIEYNPQFVAAATATDAMVVGEFEMVIGTETCPLTICLPLTPLLPKLTTQRTRVDSADATMVNNETARQLRERLGDVPVEITVRFSPVDLSPARILSLAEGDIVALSHKVGAPLTLRAGGVTFAKAMAGKSGSRLAALIVQTPQERA